MALLEDVTKGGFTTVLIGVGAAIVAPTVIPALATSLRPLAKALIKGGVNLYDSVKETVAEAGEQFNDLVAEVRSEIADSGDDHRTSTPTSTGRRRSERKE
jgi:hypothetical protein